MSVTNAVTLIGVVGPLLMSALLMRYSGVGPLEKQMHRHKPDYAGYAARTSAFFPRPPRSGAKVSA
jgi:steroid 5-alpha reductase family enzyme